MIVRDVMTSEPVHAHPSTAVGAVLDLMYEYEIRHLPIVRGSTLVGIISDRDLRRFSVSAWVHSPEETEFVEGLKTPVSAVMQKSVVSVDVEDDISEVVQIMLEERIGAVPVTCGADLELVGSVSYVDLLREAWPDLG